MRETDIPTARFVFPAATGLPATPSRWSGGTIGDSSLTYSTKARNWCCRYPVALPGHARAGHQPRLVSSGDSVAGSSWEIQAPDGRRGGAIALEDRRFYRLRRNILPGTSEQTQDIANFAARGSGSYCITIRLSV